MEALTLTTKIKMICTILKIVEFNGDLIQISYTCHVAKSKVIKLYIKCFVEE